MNPSPFAEVLYYIYTAYHAEDNQIRFLVNSESGHLPAPLQAERLADVLGYTPDDEIFALQFELGESFGSGMLKFTSIQPSPQARSAGEALQLTGPLQTRDEAVLIVLLPPATREELDQLAEGVPNSKWIDRLPGLRIVSPGADISPPNHCHSGAEQTLTYLIKEAHLAYSSIDLEKDSHPLLVTAWPTLQLVAWPQGVSIPNSQKYDHRELRTCSFLDDLIPLLPYCEARLHLLLARRTFLQAAKGDRDYGALDTKLRELLKESIFPDQLEQSRGLFIEMAAELRSHPDYDQEEFGSSLIEEESFCHLMTAFTSTIQVGLLNQAGVAEVHVLAETRPTSLEVHSLVELAIAQSLLLQRHRPNGNTIKSKFDQITLSLRELLGISAVCPMDRSDSPLQRAGHRIAQLALLALHHTASIQMLLTATVSNQYAPSSVYRSLLPPGLQRDPSSLREFYHRVVDYSRDMVMAYPSLSVPEENRRPTYDPFTESRSLKLFSKRTRTTGRMSSARSTERADDPSGTSNPALQTSAPSMPTTARLSAPAPSGVQPSRHEDLRTRATLQPTSNDDVMSLLAQSMKGFEERIGQSFAENNRLLLTQVKNEQQGLIARLEEVSDRVEMTRERSKAPAPPPPVSEPEMGEESHREPTSKPHPRGVYSDLAPRRLHYESKKGEYSQQDARSGLQGPSAARPSEPPQAIHRLPKSRQDKPYENEDAKGGRRREPPSQGEGNSPPDLLGKQPGDKSGELEDPDEHMIKGENGKALVLVHFLVRQHRGSTMDSHVLVSKATPSWKAKFAPHFELVGSRPTFNFTFYVRAFSNWFQNRARGAPAMSPEELNQCVGMLAAAAVGQNYETPPYKFEPAVEGVTTARHHWFINVDIPPKQPQESLDPRMRREGPRDVILFDNLFSDLVRSPCDGEQGYSAFSFITSDALIEDYTVTAQAHFHLEDMVGQGRLNVINAMGKTHQWWCQHRRMTMIGASADPSRNAEASHILFQQHMQRRPPLSQKDAHFIFNELKLLRDRGLNESLRSYTTVLIPWIVERSWQLYQLETSVREDAEEIPVLNIHDHERAFSHQPSLLVRYILHKIANDGKDKRFIDWLSVNEIAEKLSSMPARGVSFPGSFEPPLLGIGSKSDQFVDSVKRTLLVLRCYEAHGNGRELIELVNQERRIAYAYYWEEGETVREWSSRLIRQVKAPGLTIDVALLGEDEKRGIRQCLNGYFTLLTDQIKHARMRELYRYLVLNNPHYKGMAATMEANSKVARAVTMSQHIGSTRAFADILTDTCGYLQDMDLLQEPFGKPPLSSSRPYDNSRSRLRNTNDTTSGAGVGAKTEAETDGNRLGKTGILRKRKVTINSLDSGDPEEEAEEEESPRTDSLHALSESLKDTLKPLTSFGPGIQELVKAMNGLNARCGALDGKITGLQGDLQLHHEQRGHDAQRRLNALSDDSRCDHPDHEHDQHSSQTIMALQRQYPPRANAQAGPVPQGASTMGRGNNLRRTADVLPSELHKIPQNERPYPFYHPQTDYSKLWPEARAGLKKITGIDGPNHPQWNELDVTKLPGGHCGSCGSRRHTDGWCDSLWSQQDDALKAKGDLFVESRRQRLTWNKPPEAQLASLSQTVRAAPSLAEGISAVVNSETLAPLLADHPALAAACDNAKVDQGSALYSLLNQWEDPRTEA